MNSFLSIPCLYKDENFYSYERKMGFLISLTTPKTIKKRWKILFFQFINIIHSWCLRGNLRNSTLSYRRKYFRLFLILTSDFGSCFTFGSFLIFGSFFTFPFPLPTFRRTLSSSESYTSIISSSLLTIIIIKIFPERESFQNNPDLSKSFTV